MTVWRVAYAAPLLLGAAAIGLYYYAPHWHPSDRAFPEQGIDVSHHQGRIDWRRLPAQGVDFAYIKATEGGDFVDPDFAANWAAARAAGVRRGAYHFYNPCRPGADQAANLIATAPADADALPPAIDLERMEPCPESGAVPAAALRAELARFLALVEGHYRVPARLYLTREFDEAYAISANFDRPLWLRSIVWEPAFGTRPWAMWQASNFRRLDGISGLVDWNVVRP